MKKRILMFLMFLLIVSVSSLAQWRTFVYFDNDTVYVDGFEYPLALQGTNAIVLKSDVIAQADVLFNQSVGETFIVYSGTDTLFEVQQDGDAYANKNADSGENPEWYWYGYSTTHSDVKFGRISVSPEGNMIIRADAAGYLGGDGQSTYLFDNMGGAFVDDKRLRWGSDNDVIGVYDETTNDGMLLGLPITSKRGLIITHADTVDGDFTSLIGTTNFPDVNITDTDIDHKMKLGWIADDRPEITADTTLDIQSSGDQDLHIFGNSGVGENAILKIYGDEGGTPTFFSVAVEASGNTDINAEGNIEFGAQGTQIGQFSNKWIQMLDQRGVSFGTASQGDTRFVWDDSAHASGTNEALLIATGDTTRGIIIGDHNIATGNGGNAYDLTSVIPRSDFPSLSIFDMDRDSYMQLSFSADDTPVMNVGGNATGITTNGDFIITDDLTVNGGVIELPTGVTQIGTGATDTVSITGPVGIGTANPTTALDIVGIVQVTDHISLLNNVRTSYTSIANPSIYGASGSGTYPFDDVGKLILQSRSSGADRDIVFVTQATPTVKMVIAAAGNIGIGTTDPDDQYTQYGALPNAVWTDSDENLNISTSAQQRDTSAVYHDFASEPLIGLVASDGDVWNMTINTSDQALFENASGGYVFDQKVTMGNADYYTLTTTLSTAQINALQGTPITLVAAQGSNTWIEFVSAVITYDYATAAFTVGADEDLMIEYADGTDLTASIESAGFLDQADDEARYYISALTTASDIEANINQAIRVLNTGAGETADGGGEVDFRVTYRVHTTGF